LVELIEFLVPEGVEIPELVIVRSVEIVVLLVVALLHFEDASGLEIALELLGGEAVRLGLDVVAVLLVLEHLGEGLIEGILNFIGRSVDSDITHFYFY
jgi:hypothetical protein